MNPEQLHTAIADYVQHRAALFFLVLDTAGIIVLANAHAEKVAGRPLKGVTFSSLLVNLHEAPDLNQLADDLQTAHLFHINTGAMPQSCYFRFSRFDDGFLMFGEHDPAEQSLLNREMIVMHNELTNLSRAMQKKNVELKNLNMLKNQFLGMAAHDLRNPIGVIQSYSDFLLEDIRESLSPEHLEFLSAIYDSSKFMLSLLDDLLDIAKIEAGKLELELQPTDMIDLIKQQVTLNRLIAAKKSIHIQVHHYEELPLIQLDRLKMIQVLNNLISNAIKYSPPQTTVTVNIFKSGEHATVAVEDRGPGIPETDRQKLFMPFSRTSVKAPEGEKSTGLGLAIVRRIILGHTGKLWVESDVGKGSTFYFSLPFQRT